MPISSKYLFVVSMDVDSDKEALFNEVYDTEHIPNLLKVPGVRAVTRMAGEPFAMSIGGAEKKIAHDGPRYSAIYEIDGPYVLVSPEWASGRRGPLAGPNTAVHAQPKARPLQSAVVYVALANALGRDLGVPVRNFLPPAKW